MRRYNNGTWEAGRCVRVRRNGQRYCERNCINVYYLKKGERQKEYGIMAVGWNGSVGEGSVGDG